MNPNLLVSDQNQKNIIENKKHRSKNEKQKQNFVTK